MKNRKIISIVMVLQIILLAACGVSKDTNDTKIDTEQVDKDNEKDNKNEEINEEQDEGQSIWTTPILPEDDKDQDVQIYRDFLTGKSDLSLAFYCDNVFDEENYGTYDFGDIRDKSISFMEFIDEFEKKANVEIGTVAYAYIDCGDDGKKELALDLNAKSGSGPFANDYVVIKDIDGDLQLIYTLDGECGANGWNDLNEYGYICTYGQGISTSRYHEAALIDADGNYKYGYFDYSEDPGMDLEQFYKINVGSTDYEKCEELNEAAEAHGIKPIFYEASIPGENSNSEEYPKYYCVGFYNTSNELVDAKEIKNEEFYMNIMEVFEHIHFISKEEYDKKIADRQADIGLTDKICSGANLEYTVILSLK